MIQLLIFFGVV